MEHRLSKRIPGRVSLLVFKRGMPVATGLVQDASRRGVFVATDYDDIKLNQTVELELYYPDRTMESLRRLKAHVVRKSEQGIGLDFDMVENDALCIAHLLQWLQKHPKAQRHYSSMH